MFRLCLASPHGNNVGEFGLGTNHGIDEFIAANSHINERRCGLHLGFGQHNQSFGGTLMISTVFGALQVSAASHQVAQTMALAGTFLQLAALVGAPLGGVLGSQLGLRQTMLIALVAMSTLLAAQAIRWAIGRQRTAQQARG